MTPLSRRIIASLFTAIVVTAITQVANLLAFSVGNQLKVEILDQVSSYFLPAVLIFGVLVFLAGLAGWLAQRRFAWLVGLVAALVATLIGTTMQVAAQGQPVTAELLTGLFSTLISLNLIFIVAGTVATVTAGVNLFRLALAFRAAPVARRVALVRAPASSLAEGLVTHIKRKKVDLELADTQWDGYVAALEAAGWTTELVEPRDDLADSVFIEDSVVMLGGVAVITSPGAESRQQEIIATEATVRQLGLPVERILQPGTLDGGDVLKVGTTVYVGLGGRTNGEGIRQFRAIAKGLGFTVVAVPVTKALHLKTAVTALPDGTVIGYLPLVDNTSIFDRFLPVPEAEGTAVVVLEDDTLLMSAAAPKSAELFRGLGYRVIAVDISEFEKLEGCVTCLSVRIR
jgi:dimethylargininase